MVSRDPCRDHVRAAGACRCGALTLLRPMIRLDRFGLPAFASISGTQSAVVSICGALAPVAMGMAYGVVGAYRPLMIFMGALGLVAALTMCAEGA